MKYNKPVKVNSYYRGGSTHKIYLHKTKFQVLKELVVKRIKQAVRISLVAGAIYLIFLTGKSLGNETIINKVEAQDTLSGKIEDLKNEVLTDLITCESVGVISSENMRIGNLVTYDPDNRQPGKEVPSIGILKFKSRTFIDYYKMFYGKELTPKESVLFALDDNKAKELAKKIIFEDKGKGINNWYNCVNLEKNVKLYNLKEKVAIIKELSN